MSILNKEPDIIKDGIKYWDMGDYKGYKIFYVETPNGDRTYLAADKSYHVSG